MEKLHELAAHLQAAIKLADDVGLSLIAAKTSVALDAVLQQIEQNSTAIPKPTGSVRAPH